jgi:CheY-like chemotaxis protein
MSDFAINALPGWFSALGSFCTSGSTFVVNNEQNPPPAEPAPVEKALPLTALSALQLLLVDDDKDTRYFLGVLLRRYGAEVHSAASAEEAMTLFKQLPIDIIVSDIGMPEHSGYDLIRWIRAAEREEKRTPALALTAFGSAAHREEALRCGFDQHLPKPFEPLNVVRVLATLIGRI